MDYSKIIDLDGITLEECEQLVEKGKSVIINDWHIVNLIQNDHIKKGIN